MRLDFLHSDIPKTLWSHLKSTYCEFFFYPPSPNSQNSQKCADLAFLGFKLYREISKEKLKKKCLFSLFKVCTVKPVRNT